MNVVYLLLTFVLIEYVYCQGSYIGDFCTLQSTGASGQCQLLEDCQPAIQALQSQGVFPQTCGFQGPQPIVCCVGGAPPSPVITTSTTTTTTTTVKPTTRSTARPPTRAPTTVVVTRVGQKSDQKCTEYKKYAYPPAMVVLGPGVSNFNEDDCTIDSTQLVVGGTVAKSQEFPHMALIGFDDGSGQKLWQCGGSLISERFVVTAAHCLYTQQYGEPKYIRLGELVLDSDNDDAEPEDLLIDQAFRHPNYISPSQYNDIALLKMNKNAKMSTYVRPACLNTNPTLTTKQAIATGWGKVGYTSGASKYMLKVVLQYFSNAECNSSYKSNIGSRLKYGIVDDSQLCAGSHKEAKDTCQGDSGGPLQITKREDCMYKIVGITSFGKGCGIAGIPGVYTRVSHYIEWIEGIVWP